MFCFDANVAFGRLFLWCSWVFGCCMVGIGGGAEGGGLFSGVWSLAGLTEEVHPCIFPHWGLCTLILCAGTVDPLMQW